MVKPSRIIFDFWLTLWDPDPSEEELVQLAKEARVNQSISMAEIDLKRRELGGAFFVGVHTLLRILRQGGCRVEIATQSSQDFVVRALKLWNLLPYFDAIYSTLGGDAPMGAPKSKRELLEEKVGAQNQDDHAAPVLFIADSSSDARIAKELGFDFLHKAAKEVISISLEVSQDLAQEREKFLNKHPYTLISTGDLFKLARFILWRYYDFDEINFSSTALPMWEENRDLPSLPAPKLLSSPKKRALQPKLPGTSPPRFGKKGASS